MDKGTVYFFTGLAGAGKTTIGGLFYRRLKATKPNVVLLDGDQIRPVFVRTPVTRTRIGCVGPGVFSGFVRCWQSKALMWFVVPLQCMQMCGNGIGKILLIIRKYILR